MSKHSEVTEWLARELLAKDGPGSDLGPRDFDGQVWLTIYGAGRALDVSHLASLVIDFAEENQR